MHGAARIRRNARRVIKEIMKTMENKRRIVFR
jgi:hypothetical protein